jgi:hypothetical protein
MFSSRSCWAGLAAMASVLLGSGLAPSGQAQVISLTPDSCINPSQIFGASRLTVPAADKFSDNLSFHLNDTYLDFGKDWQPAALGAKTPLNPVGRDNSFGGPLTGTVDITKDLAIRFPATTDLNKLVSDVYQSGKGPAQGNGFSSMVEEGLSRTIPSQKIAQLEVLNPGNLNPAFRDVVTLLQPRDTLYLENDRVFGIRALRNLNRPWSSFMDEDLSQVPEPSTLVLSAIGVITLLALKRQKRAAANSAASADSNR